MSVLAFVLLMAVAPAGAPAARPVQDAADILARAAERHRALRTLRASFTQTIRNPVLEREETSSGTFYYRAPRQYRIAFAKPPEDVVVSTGEKVWIFLPSSQPGQVMVSPVGERSAGLAPYQFIYDFADRYEPALIGEEPVGGRPCYHLVMKALRDDAEYVAAELWIDKESALTRRVVVEEPNGVVRSFTLSDHRPDASLDPDLFRYSPPPGVEVFEQ